METETEGLGTERKRRRVGCKAKKESDGNEKEEGNLFSINSARQSVVGTAKEKAELPCAKWCCVLDDGRYQWDHTKLKCFLP